MKCDRYVKPYKIKLLGIFGKNYYTKVCNIPGKNSIMFISINTDDLVHTPMVFNEEQHEKNECVSIILRKFIGCFVECF